MEIGTIGNGVVRMRDCIIVSRKYRDLHSLRLLRNSKNFYSIEYFAFYIWEGTRNENDIIENRK